MVGRSTKNKGDIVFGDTIIRNVAVELGIPESQVKAVYDFIFLHIRRLARSPKVFSIPLPSIGRLYYSSEKTKHQLSSREKNDMVSAKQKTYHNTQKQKVSRLEKELQKQSSDSSQVYTVHKKRSALRNFFYTKSMNLKELENEQNQGGI